MRLATPGCGCEPCAAGVADGTPDSPGLRAGPGCRGRFLTIDLVTRVERYPGPGDVVLLQLEVPSEVVTAAVRRASASGARVVLNLAPYALVPPDVVALADPLVVNEREALLLADSESMPASLLVTFGAAGAAWHGDQLTGPEVDRSQVLDTTGAGELSVAR